MSNNFDQDAPIATETPVPASLPETIPATPPAPDPAPVPVSVEAPSPAEPLPLKYSDGEVGILRKLVSLISNTLKSEPPLVGPAKTAAECLRRNSRPPVLPGEWTRLQAWQTRWLELEKVIDYYSADADVLYKRWIAHNADHHTKISAGGSDMLLLSREQYDEHCRRVMENAKEEQRQLYFSNIPTARIIADRVARIVHDMSETMEQQEKRRHEQWGVAFNTPSAIVLQLRKTEKFCRNMASAEGATIGPKYALPYLPF